MRIFLSILFFAVFVTPGCWAQQNMLKNSDFKSLKKGRPTNWTWISKGAGKFRLVNENPENLIEIVVNKQKTKSSPILLSGGWKPETMVKLKSDLPLIGTIQAKSKLKGKPSYASLGLTFRDKNNRWLGSVSSDSIKLTEDWITISVKALPSTQAHYVQLNAKAGSGTVLFRRPVLKEKDFSLNDTNSNSKPEFWLNVDYNDEVAYCQNAGYDTYSEKEIAAFFKQCREYNVHGVLWRVSRLGMMTYHTKAGTVFPGDFDYNKLTAKQKLMSSILKSIDPLKVAVREARKNNIKIYIWMTIADEYGTDKKQETLSTNPLVLKHPEYMLVDKNGKPMKGSLCYNVPAVRKYRLDIVKELLEYKADGIYFCTRTHAFYYGKDSGCQYGYNKEIVDEYKKRYGVNILKEKFDKNKWLALRAEGLDTFFKEACKMVHDAGQKTMLGIKTASNENRGWPWGKARMNWKAWVKNKWINSLVVGQYYIPFSRIMNDTRSFRKFADTDQKIYFWMQLWHYQKRQQTPLKELIKQIKVVKFAEADGVVCHEAIGLEERVQSYWKPLAEAIKKYWQNKKAVKK